MSCTRFISDLHLGHDKIHVFSGEFRGGVKSLEEHDAWIVEQWNSVVSKHDLVMVQGDVCFDKSKMHLLKKMRGSKHLIIGNHDKFSLKTYLEYFDKVHGFMKYKGQAWLSHAPVHVQSLRGKFNIHGHVHQASVDDLRYINVSVEAVGGRPISWDDLQMLMEDRRALIKMTKRDETMTPFSMSGLTPAEDSDENTSST
jgi:calcineurin-like phosphoesterase family protein